MPMMPDLWTCSEGRNWAWGYREYRGGEVVGFVPTLDRLKVPGERVPMIGPG